MRSSTSREFCAQTWFATVVASALIGEDEGVGEGVVADRAAVPVTNTVRRMAAAAKALVERRRRLSRDVPFTGRPGTRHDR